MAESPTKRASRSDSRIQSPVAEPLTVKYLGLQIPSLRIVSPGTSARQADAAVGIAGQALPRNAAAAHHAVPVADNGAERMHETDNDLFLASCRQSAFSQGMEFQLVVCSLLESTVEGLIGLGLRRLVFITYPGSSSSVLSNFPALSVSIYQFISLSLSPSFLPLPFSHI